MLAFLRTPASLLGRSAYLVVGIVLCGIATGAYIGAGLGAGPRDGLMLGLARRGHSIRVVRTVLEPTADASDRSSSDACSPTRAAGASGAVMTDVTPLCASIT